MLARCLLCAGIAQLVEHLICNQGVGSSSLSAGTIIAFKYNALATDLALVIFINLIWKRIGSTRKRHISNFSIIVMRISRIEPPRVCRRLLIFGKRSHYEQYEKQIFT